MTKLPTESKCMFLTLQALQGLGGSAKKQNILRSVIDLMKISEEQMSIVWPSTAQRQGSKFPTRVDFALTALKKVNAVDNKKDGYYVLTERGERFLREGRDALRQADKTVRENRAKGLPEPSYETSWNNGASTSKSPSDDNLPLVTREIADHIMKLIPAESWDQTLVLVASLLSEPRPA